MINYLKITILLLFVISKPLLSEQIGKYSVYNSPFPEGDGRMKSVTAFDDTHLIGIGKATIGDSIGDVFYHVSSDGGKTWQISKYVDYIKEENNVLDPYSLGSGTKSAYVGLDSGKIDKSTDMGQTWKRIDLGYPHRVWELVMKNNDEGIALLDVRIVEINQPVVTYTKILITEDGWKTWRELELHLFAQDTDSSGIKEQIFYENDIIGYTGGYYKPGEVGLRLFVTTDKGKTWHTSIKDQKMQRITVKGDELWGVSGVKENPDDNLYNEIVKKSTNYGITWETVFIDTDSTKRDVRLIQNMKIHFISNNKAFLIHDHRLVWKTTNKGLSWTKYKFDYTKYEKLKQRAYDYAILDENKIFFRTINSLVIYNDLITDVEIDKNIINNIQAYPNPAIEYITIDFNSNQTRNIKIIDITGKTVKQFQNDDTKWNINLKGLQPGTYFFNVIQNSELIGSGKFIKK